MSTVGPFAVIGPDVTIGAGCWIGPHAVISGPTVLGEGNRVYQFASLGEAPQDMKYSGEPTRLAIGARNVFREYVTVQPRHGDRRRRDAHRQRQPDTGLFAHRA